MYMDRLDSTLEACRGLKVAVLGDLMLDRYIWGRVDRISPEAPVPVVSVVRRSHALGGSANVVNNINSLGARGVPLGVVGSDAEADLVLGLFRESQVDTTHIVRDDQRPTTLKTRIIAHDQHVARVDEERTDPVREATRQALLERLEVLLPELDALIFQDYDKGVLSGPFIAEVRERTRSAGVFTSADPKFLNFHEFGAVDLFKPNQDEICRATGESIQREDDLERIGRSFRERSGCRELVITRGAQGMACFDSGPGVLELPALRKSAIVDVSGAGDTVIVALTLVRCKGRELEQAARFAGLCAAVACGELGAVPITPAQLQRLNAWTGSPA